MKKLTILLLLLYANILFAARPLKSNDAFTLGSNIFQIEFSSDIFHSDNRYLLSLPLVFTFGISTQSDLFFASSFLTNSNSCEGSYIDCLDIGIKQNISSSKVFNFAFLSGLSSSVVESKFSSPTAFFCIISTLLFDNISLHYNLGYNQNFEKQEFKDLWFVSIGVEYFLSDILNLATDFGIGRDPSIHCSTPQSYSLFGFSYFLFHNFSVDSGISFSFQHFTRIDLITIGFTLSI